MAKKWVSLITLLIVILLIVISAYAEEELIWSNFNDDPVESMPEFYSSIPIEESHAPVLITRIRTYHWNDGNGAEPGEICAYYDDTMEEVECWQAVGRAVNGVKNVYWEVLTDFLLIPGKSYGFFVSDFDSWSYNEASDNCGMMELYGEDPAPESYEIPVDVSYEIPVEKTLENSMEETYEDSKEESIEESQPIADPTYSGSAQNYTGYAIPSSLTIGQTVLFGHYEQDNILENGAEPVEWQVLTVQNDRALLLSKNALDFRAMNDHFVQMIWENSGMRQWLNNDFYYRVFTESEKSQIIAVFNENPDNVQFGTDGGNVTEDRVFLLSYDEIMRYLPAGNRTCGVTDYARAQSQYIASQRIYDKAGMINRGYAVWWLRTPGMAPGYFMTVGSDVNLEGNGPFSLEYHSSDISYDDVRPALWVKIPSRPVGFRIRPIRRPIPCHFVYYFGKECLVKVPLDKRCYRPGEFVKVLFGENKPEMIFDGWNRYINTKVDYNKSHFMFRMPWWNVSLKAICHPTPTKTPNKKQVVPTPTQTVPVIPPTKTPTPTPTPQPTCYKVTYVGGGCLGTVPTDNRCYKPGETVTVLFYPVTYVPGTIFNGWNMSGNGVAEYGYYYNTFTMPAGNVTLTAICNQYNPVPVEPVEQPREQVIIEVREDPRRDPYRDPYREPYIEDYNNRPYPDQNYQQQYPDYGERWEMPPYNYDQNNGQQQYYYDQYNYQNNGQPPVFYDIFNNW